MLFSSPCPSPLTPLPLEPTSHPHPAMTARPRPGSAGELNETPVAAVLARRARNAAKRLKRVSEIEDAAVAGKELNEDQVRAGGGGGGGVALLDEVLDRGGLKWPVPAVLGGWAAAPGGVGVGAERTGREGCRSRVRAPALSLTPMRGCRVGRPLPRESAPAGLPAPSWRGTHAYRLVLHDVRGRCGPQGGRAHAATGKGGGPARTVRADLALNQQPSPPPPTPLFSAPPSPRRSASLAPWKSWTP